MASALDILDDLAPISELSNGRTSALLQRADHDPVILIKRNKPSYVLMNIENYRALMERIEDNEDLLLAEKRLANSTGTTISNEEVMLDLGISPSDLAEAPEPELRDIGIRVVYEPLLRNGIMTIIVVGIRSDSDAYIKANKRRKEYGL